MFIKPTVIAPLSPNQKHALGLLTANQCGAMQKKPFLLNIIFKVLSNTASKSALLFMSATHTK
jgi:hypothetical protein